MALCPDSDLCICTLSMSEAGLNHLRQTSHFLLIAHVLIIRLAYTLRKETKMLVATPATVYTIDPLVPGCFPPFFTEALCDHIRKDTVGSLSTPAEVAIMGRTIALWLLCSCVYTFLPLAKFFAQKR